MNFKEHKYPYIFIIFIIIALVFSYIVTIDRFTWVLEVFPILIALPILIITYNKFKFSNFVYVLIILHSLVLILGSIYTYAEVPLGFWMQDWFGFERNHYDRIGHLAQGFFPALLARELLIRKSPLKPGKWLNFIIISICLAVSAFYELLEWWAAASQGASADAFLGTQGDPWDAQWDMFLALIGASVALLVFSKLHNRQLLKVKA
jgi:putative membrane protein